MRGEREGGDRERGTDRKRESDFVCVLTRVHVSLKKSNTTCDRSVTDAPEIVTFTVNQKSGALTLNGSVTDMLPVLCIAEGYPLPTVTLYKVNGAVFRSQSTIRHCRTTDFVVTIGHNFVTNS